MSSSTRMANLWITSSMILPLVGIRIQPIIPILVFLMTISLRGSKAVLLLKLLHLPRRLLGLGTKRVGAQLRRNSILLKRKWLRELLSQETSKSRSMRLEETINQKGKCLLMNIGKLVVVNTVFKICSSKIKLRKKSL